MATRIRTFHHIKSHLITFFSLSQDQITRPTRPNNSTSNSQLIALRPLPEHTPCDHSIACPRLSITQENATVRLTWNLHSTPMESIKNYEIYAYKQNAAATSSDWKKVRKAKSIT